MSTDVVVVVGNPRPGSRTALAAAELGRRVADGGRVETIELAGLAGSLFARGVPAVEEAVAAVRAAGALVVASPTYKATYTGLLKAFLDHFPAGSLHGIPTVPVMVAGDARHALAVEVHLRPVLVELGASQPTAGLFLLESDLPHLAAVLDPWCGANLPLLRPRPA